MLWCLSTESRSPRCDILWGSRVSSARHRWDLPPSPCQRQDMPWGNGSKAVKVLEQKEAAGRSLAIQWHEAVRSTLCNAIPSLFLYPAWHLGQRHFHRESPEVLSSWGCCQLTSGPEKPVVPGESRDPLHPCPDHHPARHRAWLLFVGILTYFC